MEKLGRITWVALRWGFIGVVFGAVSGGVCGSATGLVLGGIKDCIEFGVFFGIIVVGIGLAVTGVLWDEGGSTDLVRLGWRRNMNKSAVLFLCTNNAARSQMAEAFLKKRAAAQFDAYSAGTEPREIHPLTIRVMNEIGIDLNGHQSKHLRLFLGKLGVRFAIFVCQKAEEKCPSTWPGALNRIEWPIDDPAACEGPDEERVKKFREVRDQIDLKIADWLTELSVSR
jgi:arsenate reductase